MIQWTQNLKKKACVLKTNIHKLLKVYSRALGLQLKWYLDFLSTQLLIWTLDPYKGPFIICLHVAFSLCKIHVLFRSVLYFITSRTLVKHRWSKRMTAIWGYFWLVSFLYLFVKPNNPEWDNCMALTVLLYDIHTDIDITLSSLVPEYLFNHP